MFYLLFWYWLCSTEWGALILTLTLCAILAEAMYLSVTYIARLTKGEKW